MCFPFIFSCRLLTVASAVLGAMEGPAAKVDFALTSGCLKSGLLGRRGFVIPGSSLSTLWLLTMYEPSSITRQGFAMWQTCGIKSLGVFRGVAVVGNSPADFEDGSGLYCCLDTTLLWISFGFVASCCISEGRMTSSAAEELA